jgi:hemerythrin-like metal-binding protein
LAAAVPRSIFTSLEFLLQEKDMAANYSWKEEYNTDVKFIDEQHQYFLNIMKDLQECLESGVCRDSASRIFFSLVHYAEHYLIQEEMYFKDSVLPSIKEHKERHAAFIRRVIQFKTDYEQDIEHTCQTMMEYLVDWFDNHILKYDKEAIDHLKRKGL